jgi:hypothetical protein
MVLLDIYPHRTTNLSKFRRKYVEKEQLRIVEEQRRLEFIRWLVTNGRLNDRVA